jgi:hypothetical protein
VVDLTPSPYNVRHDSQAPRCPLKHLHTTPFIFELDIQMRCHMRVSCLPLAFRTSWQSLSCDPAVHSRTSYGFWSPLQLHRPSKSQHLSLQLPTTDRGVPLPRQ